MGTLRCGVVRAVLHAATAGIPVAILCAATASLSIAAGSRTVAWGTTNSAPAGKLAELFGVAAGSTTDALAVGGSNPGQPPTALLTQPYAEHWNGSAWAATSVPLGSVYPSGQQTAQLNGVTEVAPGDGWAVGTVSDTSSFVSQTLAYYWNGATWTRSVSPDPAGPALTNQLSAVAARASNDVWAVGGDGSSPEESLVLHWNGSTWQQITVPNIGPLSSVTVAAGQVWIAGGDQVEESSNGTTWTKLPVLPDGPIITGVADTSAGLWAVGYEDVSCGEGDCTLSYAAVWNGVKWTVTPAGGGTELTGVVAAGSQVLATSATGVLSLTLTAAVPQVTPAIDGQLTAIAANPAGNPWAVGSTIGPSGSAELAIINAPGIGQGGISVTTGASGATVTWTGPATGAGSAGLSGQFAVGGLPDGTYTVIASLPSCQPGVATARVSAGYATAVTALISCPP